MPFVALSGTARWLIFPALAVIGCYPDFVFDERGGNGGSGTTAETSSARVAVGTGGSSGEGAGPTSTTTGPTTTSSTGASTTSSSSTGMPPVVQLNCGPPDYDILNWDWFLVTCRPGQVCCFDHISPLDDSCGTSCDSSLAYTFACDGPQDCAPGEVCCANVSGSTVIGIGCVAGCVSPNIELCEITEDCTNGGTCQQAFDDAGYDEDYLGCL